MTHPLEGMWKAGYLVCLSCNEEHVGTWPAEIIPACPYCANGVCVEREEADA